MPEIKYSILMPYYDRLNQLRETLKSFSVWYEDRNDFEINLILDNKVLQKEIITLEDIAKESLLNIRMFFREASSCNPCMSFNLGAFHSKGDFFVITNPECSHTIDILNGLDYEFALDPDVYVVCGCKGFDKEGKFKKWLQHSEYNNRGLHFCTALNKETYFGIGGFDERFMYGIAYDDDAFRDALKKKGIKFIYRDDLLVNHQFHNKVRTKESRILIERNRMVYQKYYRV